MLRIRWWLVLRLIWRSHLENLISNPICGGRQAIKRIFPLYQAKRWPDQSYPLTLLSPGQEIEPIIRLDKIGDYSLDNAVALTIITFYQSQAVYISQCLRLRREICIYSEKGKRKRKLDIVTQKTTTQQHRFARMYLLTESVGQIACVSTCIYTFIYCSDPWTSSSRTDRPGVYGSQRMQGAMFVF